MKAKVNGIELNYEIDGSGPECFVLHGGLGLDHTLYRSTLQPLTQSLRLIFVDFRNNGGSQQGPLELFRHGDRVRALVLVSTHPGGPGKDDDPTRDPMPPRPAELVELDARPLPDAKAAARYWYDAAPFFTNPGHVELLRKLMQGTLFEGPVRKKGSDIRQSWSSIDRLAAIDAPALIVAGTNDQIASPANARRIADNLPNTTLAEIDGANHWPWLETPKAFYDAVARWLEAHHIC